MTVHHSGVLLSDSWGTMLLTAGLLLVAQAPFNSIRWPRCNRQSIVSLHFRLQIYKPNPHGSVIFVT
jgi:hypothetical protein